LDSYKPEIRHIKIGRQEFRTAIWEGDPKVRPLLFFNGIGANLETVVPLARRLNRSRDLVTFDPPGIGESPDAWFPYSLWSIARSASRILDELGYTTLSSLSSTPAACAAWCWPPRPLASRCSRAGFQRSVK